MPDSIVRVAVIGAGGVASSLAPALDALESVSVIQVLARTKESSERLASRLQSPADTIADPTLLTNQADLYLICVNDDSITDLARTLTPNPRAAWVHTSGSVNARVLSPLSPHFGVFYPLQTFNRDKKVEMQQVPIFIEGSDEETDRQLFTLGRMLSPMVYRADSEARRQMHIAAVFACNFTNHLWAVAHDILAQNNLPFNVLEPLLKETLSKALSGNPADGQTGPARRGDTRIINSHLASLKDKQKEIYEILSKSISERYDTL